MQNCGVSNVISTLGKYYFAGGTLEPELSRVILLMPWFQSKTTVIKRSSLCIACGTDKVKTALLFINLRSMSPSDVPPTECIHCLFLFSQIQCIMSTQLKAYSQVNQRPISYVLDPHVATKRRKGQQITSWWRGYNLGSKSKQSPTSSLSVTQLQVNHFKSGSHTKTKHKRSQPRGTANNVTIT